jgi:hypothetical protein
MEFEIWSNKKKEQEKLAAAENKLDSVGKLYGLHPGVGQVDRQAKADLSQAPSPETKIPETPVQKPYIPQGQASRLGIEATPTKPFTFWDSPKAVIPENRFSKEGGTLLPGERADRCLTAEKGRRTSGRNLGILEGAPSTEQNTLVATGQQARTGMPPPIPSTAGTSYENLLEATPLGAYTNNWDINTADTPVPAVFSTMDDETLSHTTRICRDFEKQPGIRGKAGPVDIL